MAEHRVADRPWNHGVSELEGMLRYLLLTWA